MKIWVLVYVCPKAVDNPKNSLCYLYHFKKTEIVIFKSKQKKFEGDFKIKLCGKSSY